MAHALLGPDVDPRVDRRFAVVGVDDANLDRLGGAERDRGTGLELSSAVVPGVGRERLVGITRVLDLVGRLACPGSVPSTRNRPPASVVAGDGQRPGTPFAS